MTLWQPGMLITAGRLQDATPWVPLTSLGSYLSNAADGSSQPMARDVFVRDEVVREFKGIINCSGGTTATYPFFAFNSAYAPSDYERNWPGAGTGPSTPFRVALLTSGTWQLTGQASAVTSLRLDFLMIKSATGRIPG
ncbi:hypothetical protein [Streptomyces similanensis]|uniref:Uncharacterized protein n=1 Tax=Streptomyces similanensis TaxID=1274988 RepID=A0ABP9KHL1_9ACTN